MLSQSYANFRPNFEVQLPSENDILAIFKDEIKSIAPSKSLGSF